MKTWIVLAALALSACGGVGSLKFTTWGEEYIEDGIPAAEFEDGWQLTFSKFQVSLGGFKVAKEKGGTAGTIDGFKVFDLTKKGPFEVGGLEKIPSDTYDRVSFSIAASTAATAGNITEMELATFKGRGNALQVEGLATKGALQKRFAWAFTQGVDYSECESAGGVKGEVVPTGSTTTVQVTVHGDHFFYDQLASADAKLRFDAIAAADKTPEDGVVTLEELSAISLTTLPNGQYGTAGAPGVDTLRDFVQALSATVGHYQGEGHCHSTRR